MKKWGICRASGSSLTLMQVNSAAADTGVEAGGDSTPQCGDRTCGGRKSGPTSRDAACPRATENRIKIKMG